MPYELQAPIPGNLETSTLGTDDTLLVIIAYNLPRGQESSLLGLLDEQKKTIEVEKFPEYSNFIPAHDSLLDDKLFENT
jgi:hypothetical protein